MVGAPDHRALGGVDVGLGVLLDPTLVAAVLGRVHRDEPWRAGLARDLLGGAGHEPVVRVDEVNAQLRRELSAELAHVGVHRRHPAHERLHVLGERRLAQAVDDDPVALLDCGQPVAAAGQHVDLDALGDEVLGQLANVAREAALDDRRVLP